MKTLPLLLLVTASVATADPGKINIHLSDAVTMELIQAPAGSFRQGSPEVEPGRGADEAQRQVRISKPFYLAKYPVTVRQWRLFAQESGYRTEAEKGKSGGFGWDGKALIQSSAYTWQFPGFTQTDEHPVTTITWDDAQAFLRWMSSKTGMICRLPTEAEWEYANRAGSTTAWPGTNDRVGALTSVWSLESTPGTQPVGKRQENTWGFSDMNGQVWEWCADWYGSYENADEVDPLQKTPPPGDKPRRVLRGGSFTKTIVAARSAARYRNDPKSRNADNGFRVAADLAPNPTVVPPAPTTKPTVFESPPTPRSEPEFNPAPIPEPEPFTPPSPSSFGHSSGPSFQFPSVMLLGAIGLVIFFIIRKLSAGSRGIGYQGMGGGAPRRGVPPLRGGAIRVLPVADGFWIQADVPMGAAIQWRCVVDGLPRSGEVYYQPGPQGMMVFTGGKPGSPTAVMAPSGVDLNAPGVPSAYHPSRGFDQGVIMGAMLDQQTRHRTTSPPLRQEPSRSFPSAY